MRRTDAGIPIVRVHYSADEEHDLAWAEAQRRRYTSQAWWDMEMEIIYEARSGTRVYPEFEQTVHVIPDEQVPKWGCRFMSIDPHPRTPHAALWLLIDAWSDWYIYRELWPSIYYAKPGAAREDLEDHSWTIREYAETISVLEGNRIEWQHAEQDRETGMYRRNEGGEKIIYRFMDQAGKGFKATAEHEAHETYSSRYDRYGIRCSDPIKSHSSGEDAIRDLLKVRKHEVRGTWPRLHIAASCRELIYEMLKHRYKKSATWNDERDLRQDPVEARSHMIDNLRYLATGRLSFSNNLAS